MAKKKTQNLTINFDEIATNEPPRVVVMIDESEARIEILVYREDGSWIVEIWNDREECFSTKRAAERFIRLWLKEKMRGYEKVAKEIKEVLKK